MPQPLKPAKLVNPWRIMDPVRGQIRLGLLLSCLSSACTLTALLALAWCVQEVVRAQSLHQPAVITTDLPWLPLTFAAVATIAAYVLRRLSFDQSHFAAFRLENVLRTQLTAHIAQLSLGRVQQLGTGALTKVVFDDVKELHVYVADSTPLYARAYFLPLATLGVLLWLNWPLALTAMVVVLIGLGILRGVMKDRPEIMRQYNFQREQVSAAIIEYVQAMPVVRNFDTGQTTFSRYQRALDEYLATFSALWRRMGLPAKLSMALLNPLPTLAVLLWLGAYGLWHESLTFSTWVAALLLGTGMAEALVPLHNIAHLIDRAKISINRIQEILALPILPQVERQISFLKDASVVFDEVSFRYDHEPSASLGVYAEVKRGKPVMEPKAPPNSGDETATFQVGVIHADSEAALTHVSFTAAPGTVTALVGPSGAGKTTVARLIPRFWDVDEGRILVGGVDVRDLPLDALMAQVAFVFQDTFLFSGSIADNIRLGLPEATLKDVQTAARAAQAHDFISQLPQGYDTDAGERGIFLSGGQRQRITIARAILQNRPILVLDEATAFADPENEAAIVAALSELMRDKTVLMVAHRLSTITHADQILVFDKGQLVECGQHEALLNRHDGVYTRLWRSYQQAQNWALRGSPQTREHAA